MQEGEASNNFLKLEPKEKKSINEKKVILKNHNFI